VHSIPQFQPQYRMINRAQEVWTYDTLEDAVRALNKASSSPTPLPIAFHTKPVSTSTAFAMTPPPGI
jgi:hypothetical protein